MNQRGIALIVTLWVVVAIAALAGSAVAVARDATTTASRRMGRVRTNWEGRGCLAQVRRSLDRALEDGDPEAWAAPERLWIPTGCRLTWASPSDGPADVNRADAARLATLPGFDSVLAQTVVRRREDVPFAGLDDLIARLGPANGDRLARAYAGLRARTTFAPWAWDVTAVPGAAGEEISQRWVWGGDGPVTVVRERAP